MWLSVEIIKFSMKILQFHSLARIDSILAILALLEKLQEFTLLDHMKKKQFFLKSTSTK